MRRVQLDVRRGDLGPRRGIEVEVDCPACERRVTSGGGGDDELDVEARRAVYEARKVATVLTMLGEVELARLMRLDLGFGLEVGGGGGGSEASSSSS